MRLLRSLLLLAFLGSTAAAQTVRWQPAGGTLARGQASDLVLIFDNCEPTGDIPLPSVPNLQFGTANRGQQSSTNIINGRVQSTRYVYFSYPARPLNDNTVVIPSFTVETDQGTATVPSVSFEVREATIGNTSIPVSSVAQANLQIGNGQIWAGEVVPVQFTLSISGRFRANIVGGPVWEPAPLVAEEWGQATGSAQGTGQDLRNLVSYSSRGYLSKPGTYVLPSIQHLVNIGVPTAGIFQSIRAEQYAITSDSPPVMVRPLPSPAPADFDGAVGTFSLRSKVVPQTATVGEPVTWTLSLEGTGNWPEISVLPKREASRSFRVVQPQAVRTTVEGKLFEGSITEDVVLIPTQNGEYSLGPVTWSFFNPKTGRYETLTAPATVLKIEGSLAPVAPNVPANSNSSTGLSPEQAIDQGPYPTTATPVPDSPAAIPRDPLPGAGSAFSPLAQRDVIAVAIAIVALFPLLWVCLSWRHAVRHDTGRSARQARRTLATRLTQLRTASADRPKRDQLLLAWQQSTAVLWRTPQAAPTTQLFQGEEKWTTLWHDADRALFGQDRELPADWVNRAETALARKRAPRFPIFSILSFRNLFPVLVALLALGAIPDLNADDAVNAYAKGEFTDAESTWREALQTNATDWIAHHNLSLALAQQNRWEEAGAHAAVAFVQNPRNPSVRWHLTYTLQRCGYTPPVIGRFTDPGWAEKFAQLASPAEWQLILLAGLLLGMLSLALVLAHAYGLKLKPWKLFAWFGGIVGIIAMVLAMFGLQVYGLTANADAVLTWRATQLRSIPTDLNSEQQTSALFPGSLARVQKSFLGWRQIGFPNEQTGWVRKEELVPLWRNSK
jgi:tetratricopeptide (TPR) repeat protein